MVDEAKRLTALGLRVMPLVPGGKTPVGPWQHLQGAEPGTALGDFEADHNLAILTGNGIVVLDVDGDEGRESLRDLVAEHGPLPNTVESITGSGGRHIFFQCPEHIPNAVGIRPGLDVRADGGYVVAPPSLHPNGRHYEWELSSRPGEVPVAPAPAWLLSLLRQTAKQTPTGVDPGKGDLDQLLAGPVQEGGRNDALARLVGRWLGRGDDPNEVLLRAEDWAMRRCQPPLPLDEVHRTVESITAREQSRRQDLRGGDVVFKAAVRPVKGMNNLKAFADLTINDSFVVKNLRVLDGKNGLFVSMPSEKGKDGEYREIAHPVTAEARKEISEAVLEAYRESTKEQEAEIER